MKNKESILSECRKRVDLSIKRGRVETASQTKGRLLNCLSKSWYGHDGTLWTLRSYLIKYNLAEYKSILSCISRHYRGATRFNSKGQNLDQFNFFHNRINGIQRNHVSFDGRLPVSAYLK